MIRYKTKYTNQIGDESYPIYLIINGDDLPDLECRFEIPACAWFEIYTNSIEDYLEEKDKT